MPLPNLPKLKKFAPTLPSLQNSVKAMKGTTEKRPDPLRTVGDRSLKLQTRPFITKGPGDPPTDWSGAFPGGASAEEWWVYWGLAKVFRDPKDPRQGPFLGGRLWKYQQPIEGGRLTRGGQVLDFEVTWGSQRIAIRLMTERFHVFAKQEQQMRDLRGKIALSKYDRVCDLWSQNFLDDPTGEAVCTQIADCLRSKQSPDPFTFDARRTRQQQPPRSE